MMVLHYCFTAATTNRFYVCLHKKYRFFIVIESEYQAAVHIFALGRSTHPASSHSARCRMQQKANNVLPPCGLA